MSGDMKDVGWEPHRLTGGGRPVVPDEDVVHEAVFLEPVGYREAPRRRVPRFATAAEEARRREAHREALGHVLRAVSGSPWADELVLRGSLLLRAWYGAEAREPGDVDLVVLPPELPASDHWSRRILEGVAALAEHESRDGERGGDVEIDAGGAVWWELFAYSDSPGRRLSLPWRSHDGWLGSVQIDFSFGEPLPQEPDVAFVPVPGGEVPLRSVTPELSLAWKLHWLVNEIPRQPKDLYDAWLLARHARVDRELVRAVAGTARIAGGRDPLDVRPKERPSFPAHEWYAACPDGAGPPERYVRELAERLREC
ncbi:nucleotidyl transferase AbiEii/AbiGii toxin family protein [Actinomadura sp. WMMB 499]|uniref:nucleotidyl transferase AbiEii/AbiGii toxin family protein n=1 Tax=Actinomadura sp. WMMB 499 TaxID=1219491 RepID=UPI0012443969|nr:nucleotidyl transferase AbiEii/AbiGii toxin family protein [Actinomadura sp. WMMB 499]QFG21097.1 nucleotidyl transferase AbiEii/AbiGii toxin family protein [Actinomadura sp. WMMB 499]